MHHAERHGVSDRREWPAVTADQMREVDRIMVEDLHIELVQMMENAGRALAVRLFAPTRVAVIAGPRGNGGGGLVAARHLANRGVCVRVVLTHADDAMTPVPAHQLDIVRRMRLPVHVVGEADLPDVLEQLGGVALIVDALVGYSLSGPLTGAVAGLALDTPSGVHATTGPTGAVLRVRRHHRRRAGARGGRGGDWHQPGERKQR